MKIGDKVICIDSDDYVLIPSKRYTISDFDGYEIDETVTFLKVKGLTNWYFADRFKLIKELSQFIKTI